MPIMRSIMKLAVGYAVTKMLTRAGGPAGLVDSLFSGGRKRHGHDERTNRGAARSPRQKRADAYRRHD